MTRPVPRTIAFHDAAAIRRAADRFKASSDTRLRTFSALLLPSGAQHLALVTGDGEERDNLGSFHTHSTVDELRGLLGQVGFTVHDEETGDGIGFNGKPAPWIVLRAAQA